MLNLLASIKWIAGAFSLTLFALTVYLLMPESSWVTAIFTSFLSTFFGAISYVGFKVENKIEDATQVAFDVVGQHAEKISDAVVERVKKV